LILKKSKNLKLFFKKKAKKSKKKQKKAKNTKNTKNTKLDYFCILIFFHPRKF